ncbi:hypothetical protein EJ08DRAFT_669189 [Tothia fuscella]|uniref:Glycosyltransferase family 2 protein n=1 Tax=Tothia fuscella TaxID=1048955 RepID=A0A9P4NWI4_9PEZI|nr:hypothetical protein EJ08DRAFT_669189 [Tothia fuscella]
MLPQLELCWIVLSVSAVGSWRKPPGIKVIGLVFYGRKQFVEILDCYLKRNLKENGGILDEVIFAVHTDNEGDLEYLDRLVNTTSSYTKYKQEGEYESWVGSWEKVERGNIYVKIDDDVVYFEDDTIPAIVKRMVENPHYFAVSANSINNPALSWIHYGLGVYEPYLPELTPPSLSQSSSNTSWRASELPSWSGPKDFAMNGDTPAPFPGHRWLPVRPQERDIVDTPAGALRFDAYGPGWTDWSIAAQTHYSFLQHIEEGGLWRYKFNMWDYQYYRLSVNFIGFWGNDIVDAFPFPSRDDEEYLTTTRPKELGRHVVLDGTVLSAHFAFGPQRRNGEEEGGLYHTDLLNRYKAYAAEMSMAGAELENLYP